MRIWEYQAGESDADMRLSIVLAKRFHLTRRQISRLKFQDQGILVNEKRQHCDYIVAKGDVIAICLKEALPPSEKLPWRTPIPILYENDDVIAVHKPSSMAFHPSHGHYEDTLSVQLTQQLLNAGRGSKLHAVGRLDKDTSGIALFAKHAIIAQRLHQQLQTGVLKKEYRAIVHGCTPDKGQMQTPIRKRSDLLNRMEIHPQGKSACTYYERLSAPGAYSLLRITLQSGRTHQIRVHLQSEGYPLAGDVIYGLADGCTRLALHAQRLMFIDPFSKERIVLEDHDESFDEMAAALCVMDTRKKAG